MQKKKPKLFPRRERNERAFFSPSLHSELRLDSFHKSGRTTTNYPVGTMRSPFPAFSAALTALNAAAAAAAAETETREKNSVSLHFPCNFYQR